MDNLTKFSDPSAMKALLSECLPLLCSDSGAITRCHVQHVKYSPKKKPENASLTACYHLGVRGRDSQRDRQVILYGKAFCNGRSQEEFDALAQTSRAIQTLHAMPYHFRDLDLLLWVFPADPAIPHLPEVSDPERVKAYLPYPSLPKGLDGAGDIRSVEMSVINYRPEIRCTTKYDLSWGTANQPQHLTIFGKTFRSGEGHDVYARSEYLWNRYSGVDEEVLFSQPLGYTSAVQTLWQLGVEGTPLCSVIKKDNCDSYLRTVAKGLAMIHNSDLADLPTWTLDEHLLEVDKKIEKLRRAAPSLVKELDFLAQHIHRDAPNPSDIPLRPVYWDFHVNQLLAQGGKIAFFDFDELALGDPVQDLANFIVDLQFRDVSGFLARRMAKSLYASYRSQVKWEVPIERVRWHETVQFINKAYRSFIQQRPDVDETVKGIVQRAAQDITLDWLDNEPLIEEMPR
ncbi:MAG: aminoglycoside phosphotransferase family protein [Nitrospirota bacterium]